MGGVGAVVMVGATVGAVDAVVAGAFASDVACLSRAESSGVFTEAAASILARADVSVAAGAVGAIAAGGDVGAGARPASGAASCAVELLWLVRVRI